MSWKINLASSSSKDDSKPQLKIFNYLVRIRASLKNKLVKVNQMALNTWVVGTKPSKHRNCMTCPAIYDQLLHRIYSKNIKPYTWSCFLQHHI